MADPPPTPECAPAHAGQRLFFRDVPWLWRDVFFCFGPSFISAVVRRLLPLAVVGFLQRFWLPSLLADQAWLMGYTLWAAHRRRSELPALPRARTVLAELCWIPALLPAALAAMIGGYFVAALVVGGGEPPNEGWAPITRSASRAEFLVLAITAVTVAPIAEEFAFRALLYNKLRQSLPKSLALVLQAIAFGLAHYPFGLEFGSGITAAALVIGVFYEWRKTIVAPVLLHASVNLIGLALMMANLAADAAAPRLGVYAEAGAQGCVVTGIVAGGSADRAGLKVGDVISAVDGTAVRNFRELAGVVRQKRVGDRVAVDFTRQGKPERVEADLTRPPADQKKGAAGP